MLVQAEADVLHARLVGRADEPAGCTEGSPEEQDLAVIADAIDAYEAVRGPNGAGKMGNIIRHPTYAARRRQLASQSVDTAAHDDAYGYHRHLPYALHPVRSGSVPDGCEAMRVIRDPVCKEMRNGYCKSDG
jgi:hypothetical protein